MFFIDPPLPAGQTIDQVNPDLAFCYELAEHFRDRKIALSLEDHQLDYLGVDIGFTRRPDYFPYVSIQTADADFSVKTLGRGAGEVARNKGTEFALIVVYEDADQQLGYARLTDIKWNIRELMIQLSGGGHSFRYLDVQKIEMMGLTKQEAENEITENAPWGYRGQVIVFGSVEFK
ncbi:hypothetical protein Dxin01_00182 [Deinococcus xinjiangensis]|uniref:Uncharacterized protein n=1 Tax=Deinococcus xinjiangensis TaxID=457454 RepID=A0ABP9V5D2_9DEIO